jgi:Protein of unknown function (DUF1236)
MRIDLLRSTTLALALIGVAAASAQTAPPDAGVQNQNVGKPGDTAPRGPLPGPNATPPAANAQSPAADNAVQPVPGAMPDSDTVPSTISAKNAADDKLITIAYTFKNLTDDERRAIHQALKDQPAGTAFNADVGTALPPAVELQPMPAQVVAQVPQTRDYQFVVADNRVLLVSPASRIVVAVFPAGKEPETTGGR